MTTELARIPELLKGRLDMKFNSIGHLINDDLEENLRNLVQRLKYKSYRPKPARKEGGDSKR